MNRSSDASLSSPVQRPAKTPDAGTAGLQERAVACYRAGNLGEAQRLCLQALAIHVGDARCLHLLGLIENKSGNPDAAVKMMRRAVAADDGEIRFHLSLAGILNKQGKVDEAIQQFEQALRLDPDSVEATYDLGLACQAAGKLDRSVSLYEQAIRLQPDHAGAYNNLGAVLLLQGKLEEAVACFQRTLDFEPNSIGANSNLAGVLQAQCKLEAAAALFAKVLALDPGNVETHFNESLLQLLQGDYAAGWRNYEWRFQIKKIAPRSFPQPLWRGEPLNGARILLHDEQGLGDSLQFLRYLPLVLAAGGSVILLIPEKLRRIAEQLHGVARIVHSSDPLSVFDCHCPLMSLPVACRTTLDTIPAQVPYLSAPREAEEKAAALAWPTAGLRVGLAWAGAPGNSKDRNRSIPLALLKPLFGLENVHFFSLQMGAGVEQLVEVQAAITDLAPATRDFADTAAQMAHLDLVITVDTAVAHMAGALARPTWVLLSYATDWRWLLDRADSPWYPTTRLFRQPKLGDWAPVIEAVRIALFDRSLDSAGRRSDRQN